MQTDLGLHSYYNRSYTYLCRSR